MKIYGVMDWLGNFTDVSTNEKTAKRHTIFNNLKAIQI